MAATTLPTGPKGRLLAAALLLLAAIAAWVGLASPLLTLYDDRAALLYQRQLLAQRMARLATTLPALQRAAQAAPAQSQAPALLDYPSDALAAAALQDRIQSMAATDGATLTSTDIIPPVTTGAYRQIALRLTLSAPWPSLVHLLQSIDQSTPRLLVDDLQLHAIRLPGATADQPLEASLAVIAYRAATP